MYESGVIVRLLRQPLGTLDLILWEHSLVNLHLETSQLGTVLLLITAEIGCRKTLSLPRHLTRNHFFKTEYENYKEQGSWG